jgi:hypothetical protein
MTQEFNKTNHATHNSRRQWRLSSRECTHCRKIVARHILTVVNSLPPQRSIATGLAAIFREPRPIQRAASATLTTLVSRGSRSTRTGDHLYVALIVPLSLRPQSLTISQDITARAPVTRHDSQTRASLDSYRFPQHPRSALDHQRKMDYPPPTAEEPFEDVGLDDHKVNSQTVAAAHQRKRGFFSKFSDGQDKESVSRFLIPSRKRGQSGQGSELGSMDYPKVTVTPDN